MLSSAWQISAWVYTVGPCADTTGRVKAGGSGEEKVNHAHLGGIFKYQLSQMDPRDALPHAHRSVRRGGLSAQRNIQSGQKN